MARQGRFVLPGHPQHVIQRGNNRDVIFAADKDYRRDLDTLGEACQRWHCHIHDYVLMTNHVHLLITPETRNGFSQVMQSLGRRYVQYFNRAYHRTGTLWEGRYRSTLLDTDQYLLTCYRYIELNPVRAAIVEHRTQYPWSSYSTNAGGRCDGLVEPHALYLMLGKNAEERQSAYRALFRHQINGSTLDAIREATNKAWVLGSGGFQDRIEALTGRRSAPKARGGHRKAKAFRKLEAG